jgi:hypothetical protein
MGIDIGDAKRGRRRPRRKALSRPTPRTGRSRGDGEPPGASGHGRSRHAHPDNEHPHSKSRQPQFHNDLTDGILLRAAPSQGYDSYTFLHRPASMRRPPDRRSHRIRRSRAERSAQATPCSSIQRSGRRQNRRRRDRLPCSSSREWCKEEEMRDRASREITCSLMLRLPSLGREKRHATIHSR